MSTSHRRTDLLVLHNAYLHVGGEETVVRNEVSLLRRKGLNVELRQYPNRAGIAGSWSALRAPFGGGLEWEAENELDRLKPGILHVHNLFPSLSPRIFKRAKSQGTALVQTLHNFRPLCLNGLFLTPRGEICERCGPGSYWPGILRGCYRKSRSQSAGLALHLNTAGSRKAYWNVDRFIAPSEFLRDKFVAYGFPSDRFVVQGHFLPEMSNDPPAPPGAYLLYVGRLSREKGVDWLLEVFAKEHGLPPLYIMGDGPLRTAVASQARQNIQYLGFVTGVEKNNWIRNALAIVLPSLCYENFPMAVAEAHSEGVPAIVADQGGMRELVTPGINGERFTAGDGEAFRQAVARLSSAQHSADWRRRIQDAARQRYSADLFAEVRLRLYRTLLDSRESNAL